MIPVHNKSRLPAACSCKSSRSRRRVRIISCFSFSDKITLGTRSKVDCPSGFHIITDKAKCTTAASSWLTNPRIRKSCLDFPDVGCVMMTYEGGLIEIYFNTCAGNVTATNLIPICEKNGKMEFLLFLKSQFVSYYCFGTKTCKVECVTYFHNLSVTQV